MVGSFQKRHSDNGVTLQALCFLKNVCAIWSRPLRDAGWSVEVGEPDAKALHMTATASHRDKRLAVALLFSCGTANSIYQMLAEKCDVILYRGAPYHQESFAHGVSIHVGPVLGWQPPQARWRWRFFWDSIASWIRRCLKAMVSLFS